MAQTFLILASALILGSTFTTSLVITPGKCKVKWLFGTPCSNVSERLTTQMKTWEYMYELKSSSLSEIEATCTSFVTKSVNSLEFVMDQSKLCRVFGVATMEDSAVSADSSSNYCSMQNLIEGSGLVNDVQYRQFTNMWMCPGFETAKCTLP